MVVDVWLLSGDFGKECACVCICVGIVARHRLEHRLEGNYGQAVCVCVWLACVCVCVVVVPMSYVAMCGYCCYVATGISHTELLGRWILSKFF